MSFKDLFKGLDNVTEVAKKYIKEPKNIKKTFEGIGSTIQSGVEGVDNALSADPGMVGSIYNSQKGGLSAYVAPFVDKQSRIQINNQRIEADRKHEISKKAKETAAANSKGKDTAAGNTDVFRNSLTETGAAIMGAAGAGQALLAEGAEQLGLIDERKFKDRLAENNKLVDRGKRALKNKDFLNNYDINTFDPETLKYWDPEVKHAFLNKINHPDIDFHEEAQIAKEKREKEASVQELQKRIDSGSMTREEALKILDAQEASLGARRLASEIIMDPLNVIDVAEVGVKIGSKLLKGAKGIDKAKEVTSALAKTPIAHIDEYDTKTATKVVEDYENIIKEQKVLDDSLDKGKITVDDYVNLSDELETKKATSLDFLKNRFGVEGEHLLKDPAVHATEIIQDVKKLNPGISNEKAVEVVMSQKTLMRQEDIIKRSDEIVNNFMSNEGLNPDPVMKNAILNKEPVMYTPPKLKIDDTGKLMPDTMNVMAPQPVQLEFTNSVQRLLFEFSTPYIKAIGEGMGFKSWDQYRESMKEIDKVVIQPLAKVLFGDAPTPKQITKLKENLGAIKSNIDKELTRRGDQPGRVLNVGQLENVNNMIEDLIRGNIDTSDVSRASTDVGGFYEPATKNDLTVFSALRDKADQEIEFLVNSHGMSKEEATSLVRGTPVVGSSNYLSGPGMSDGLTAAINEGKLAKGEAKAIDKAAAIEHEKLHIAVDHLYSNGVGDVLESKMERFERELPIRARKQFEAFFNLLEPPTSRDFVDEVSAYTRQYRVLKGHAKGDEIIKSYDALKFIDDNPELRKELMKWDDLIKKQEEVWAVERAKIVRESKKLKPGQIPTRKINMNSYIDNSSSLKAKQYDEVNRQDRMKQLLGEDQMYEDGRPVVYRGEEDLYTPRIDTEADDAMLGPGHYTSSDFNQASRYTNIGGYDGFKTLDSSNPDPKELERMQKAVIEAKSEGRNPQLYQEAIELEKPLFWDERPKSDILEAFEKTKDQRLIEFKQYLDSDPYFIKTGNMSDMMNALPNFADEFGIERADIWDAFKKDILDPNGYDGMISKSTDGDEGYEFVNFNLHQVKRKTGKGKYGFDKYENIEKRKKP